MVTALRLLVVLVVMSGVFAPSALALAHEAAGSELPAPVIRAEEEEGDAHSSGGTGQDVTMPVIWTLAGIGASAVVMAVLYLLKRRLGGFPRHPSWVAPISIERSSTFLDETKMGDLPADGHGGAHH